MTLQKQVILVRHGEAKSAMEDPQRSLTVKGKKQVECVALTAAKMNLDIHQIHHSKKKRAIETAEIFNHFIHARNGCQAVEGLSPNDDIQPMVKNLEAEKTSVILVGHLPYLEKLAAFLITKNQEKTVVSLPPAGTVSLQFSEGLCYIDWMITPKLLI